MLTSCSRDNMKFFCLTSRAVCRIVTADRENIDKMRWKEKSMCDIADVGLSLLEPAAARVFLRTEHGA